MKGRDVEGFLRVVLHVDEDGPIGAGGAIEPGPRMVIAGCGALVAGAIAPGPRTVIESSGGPADGGLLRGGGTDLFLPRAANEGAS